MIPATPAVAVFFGGALGTLSRWGISEAIPVPASGFPVGTFVANVTGAFLLAYATAAIFERPARAARRVRHLRQFLGIGFLGAYTTFSTLAMESVRLVEEGAWSLAAGYWIATVLVGQMAGVYGLWLAKLRARPPGAEQR